MLAGGICGVAKVSLNNANKSNDTDFKKAKSFKTDTLVNQIDTDSFQKAHSELVACSFTDTVK
jgi:hypothetical protein